METALLHAYAAGLFIAAYLKQIVTCPAFDSAVLFVHIMDAQNTLAKQRSCYKCGYQAETAEKKCPRCSRPLQTSSSIRIRGLLLVLCGLVLMVIMGYVSIWAVGVFNNSTPGGPNF